MPNVLNAEPVRVYARRLAAAIPDARAAGRFDKLAYACLASDERNFRAARPEEVAAAPAWAANVVARGETLHVFRINRGAAQRLRTLAARVADACAVAALDPQAHAGHGAIIADARKMLECIECMSLDAIAQRTLPSSRLIVSLKQLCPEAEIKATQSRVWRRVTSLAALRAVGREFGNCLARTTQAGSYGGALVHGAGQFWVLRDNVGAGLLVAFAAAPAPTSFSEVKGPRNAHVARDNRDLAALAAALGCADAPPPPPPRRAVAPNTLVLDRFGLAALQRELLRRRLHEALARMQAL